MVEGKRGRSKEERRVIVNYYGSRSQARAERRDGNEENATSRTENIIKAYFETEFFPETVYVYFGGEIGQDGLLGYTFNIAE